MTQSVREVSAVCPHARLESALVESLDFSLARDAYRAGMGPSAVIILAMMNPLSRKLNEIAREHIPSGKVCIEKMIAQLQARLDRKIAGITCPDVRALLLFAVEGKKSGQRAEIYAHVNDCPECNRDVRQMKSKLPDYKRFLEWEPLS